MELPAPESVSVLKVKFTEEISPVWGPQVLSLEYLLTAPSLSPWRLSSSGRQTLPAAGNFCYSLILPETVGSQQAAHRCASASYYPRPGCAGGGRSVHRSQLSRNFSQLPQHGKSHVLSPKDCRVIRSILKQVTS